jgi:FHS family glucose/mannose:H+ symporter-like MFS transporter
MVDLPIMTGSAEAEPQQFSASESGRAFSAFLLLGILTSVLAALLPVWGYHLESNFVTAGNFFLCLNAGLLIGVRRAPALIASKGLAHSMVWASTVASVAFLLLAWTPLFAAAFWRAFALLLLGCGAGLLNAAVFERIAPLFYLDRAATTTLAGTVYGLGCFLTALLVAGSYYAYSVPMILVLLAAIPALYTWLFSKGNRQSKGPVQLPLKRVLAEFKNPSAVLFAVLLFIQFGNEWSIAGWLPIFLIRRIGISPETSLYMLAFYWGALMVGRVVAKALLKKAGHGKLLLSSILLAFLGCVILSNTPNRFGANTGILFTAAGFALILPLVMEKIGHQFTYYHPGLYNGIFAFALTGGLLAPTVLGYLAKWFGVGVIMVLPMFGMFLVFVLVLLIMLESKLNGDYGASARA